MAIARLATLEAQRAELSGKGVALVTLASAAGGYSASQQTQRDEYMAQLGQLDSEIAAEKLRRSTELGAPAVALNDDGTIADARRSATGRLFAEMFGPPSGNGGFKSFDEYATVVHSGRADPRLQAAMSTTVGQDGGFLVPDEFSAELLDGSLEDEIVRPRATVYPMSSNTRKIGGFDGSDHTDGSIFGMTARWMAENATNTEQQPKTVLLELHAQKLAIYASASNELAADGMNFDQMLGGAMRAATSFGLDRAFLTGNGVGKPLGVLNDPALITVSKEAGQEAASVVYENLVAMMARLHPALFNKSVWVANVSTIPHLSSLVLNIGVGGAPVLTQRADGSFAILTRPVIFTEKLPALGTKGDIMLVDFSQYAIGLRKEMTLDKSNAPGWFEDETAYRTIVRVDGHGRWVSAVTPLNGPSLSWAVALATRS
jgi:HK97 family phage major capsid protein